MKKLLNILLIKRIETENKWWHRLVTVILFLSGVVVFIFVLFATIVDHQNKLIIYRPLTFSLEPNYREVKGIELDCEHDLFAFPVSKPEPLSNGAGIKCDGVVLSEFDSKRYEKLYQEADKNLEKQFGLDKYDPVTNCPTAKGTSNLPELSCLMQLVTDRQADPSYPEYQSSLKNLAHIKVIRVLNLEVVLNDALHWLIIPIFVSVLWIVFWSHIVYRSILYIIFGKEKIGSSNIKTS